jgi:hypothetical protein
MGDVGVATSAISEGMSIKILNILAPVMTGAGRKLVAYGNDNTEYKGNVAAWQNATAYLLGRVNDRAWTKRQILDNFKSQMNVAADILATPSNWTAYIGPELSVKLGSVGTKIGQLAEDIAVSAASSAGKAVSAALKPLYPVLIGVGVVGILGLYFYGRTR